MFVLPSPIQYLCTKDNIEIYVKRDDLIHPTVSGNKWRKLKFQIKDIVDNNRKGLITFGGAFSNHILATAAAGQHFGLPTVGIIRGESTSKTNATLSKAAGLGMRFHFVNRADYKLKELASTIKKIIRYYTDYAVIPEGGKHPLAFAGVAEIITECVSQMEDLPEYYAVAIGTGTTFSGILRTLPRRTKLIGIPVLKHQKIEAEICEFLEVDQLPDQGVLLHDYHFGGYAKFTPELLQYMKWLSIEFGLKTDIVYTSKVFYAIWDLIEKEYFTGGSKVVIIHTGGLQGNEGMNERYPEIEFLKGLLT